MTLRWMGPGAFGAGIAVITIVGGVLRWLGSAGAAAAAGIEPARRFVEEGRIPAPLHDGAVPMELAWGVERLFGGAAGARAPGWLLGTLTVVLVALLARRLSSSDLAAQLAALLIAVDPLHVSLSRLGAVEVHAIFFLLAGVAAALAHLDGGRSAAAIAAGALLGLALSSSLLVAAPIGVVVVYVAAKRLSDSGAGAAGRAAEGLLIAAAFLVVPLTVYFLSYAPAFVRGGASLADWLRLPARGRATLGGLGAGSSAADVSPLLWFVQPWHGGRSSPLSWMATLPAFAALCWRAVGCGEALLALGLVCGAYAPFVAMGSRAPFQGAALVLPFAGVVVAWAVDSAASRLRRGSWLVWIYAASVAATAVPLCLRAAAR